jgi:hypothetical protein
MKYSNRHWGYELEFPSGWHSRGIIARVLHPGRSQNAHPVFYGPGNVSLMVATGHGGLQNLVAVAERAGHKVINVGTIAVSDISHDTLLCDVPAVRPLKSYAIRIGTVEHLITTDALERIGGAIVSTFQSQFTSDEEGKRTSTSSIDGSELTHRSFRTAVLLYKLFERGEKTQSDKRFLIEKGFYWIRSTTPERVLVGLNVLRFLFRAKDIEYSQEFLDEIVKIFFRGGSFPSYTLTVRPAVRLAALDLLANMSVSPNPVTKLPKPEQHELVNFRTEIMKTRDKNQNEKDKDAQVARESTEKTYSEAMRSIASRV